MSRAAQRTEQSTIRHSAQRTEQSTIRRSAQRTMQQRWLWLLGCTAFATALLAIAGGDAWSLPYQFGDDLVFDVAGWSYTEEKVRGEARWLVWAWHEVIGTRSVATDYRLAAAAWCAACALLAERLTRGAQMPMLVTTVALAASPAAMRMLQWPHSELPMMVTLAVGLLFLDATSSRDSAVDASHWRGAVIATVCAAAMLAFQLFALLVIAAAMMIAAIEECREPEWNASRLLRTLSGVLLWGSAGCVVGLLTGYTLNWFAFGFFGLDIATWRIDAVPDGNRLSAAVQSVLDILAAASTLSKHLLGPVLLAAMSGWVWLARRRRDGWRMIALLLALTIGIVLSPGVVTLLSGASVPPDRSGLNVWFVTVAWLVLLAERVLARPRAVVIGALAAFAAVGVWSNGREMAERSEVRQAYDRHLDRIETDVRRTVTEAGRVRLLVAVGDTSPFAELGTRRAWWVRALLRSRLEPELVANAVYCPRVADCQSLGPPAARPTELPMPAYPADGYLLRSGDVLLMRFDDQQPP